jgi:hypothetical protein
MTMGSTIPDGNCNRCHNTTTQAHIHLP